MSLGLNMAHYAFIKDQIVVKVIVGVDENVTQLDENGNKVGGSSEAWESFYSNQEWHRGLVCKRTSYSGSIRGRFAGIGYTYLEDADVFIAPQPFESWKLNSFYEWEAPKPYPNDGSSYYWNEDSQEWTKPNEL